MIQFTGQQTTANVSRRTREGGGIRGLRIAGSGVAHHGETQRRFGGRPRAHGRAVDYAGSPCATVRALERSARW
jgi:hypothetical protein